MNEDGTISPKCRSCGGRLGLEAESGRAACFKCEPLRVEMKCPFCPEPLRCGEPMRQWAGKNYDRDSEVPGFKQRILAHEACAQAHPEGADHLVKEGAA